MNQDASVAAELGTGWFGAGLSPHAVTRLSECCASVTSYPVDAVIMREGDDTHPFGIVASGRVALRLLVPERGATTILTVEPGDVLGWSALVPPYRATSTAIAIEPSELLVFDARALRDALDEDEDLAAALYPRLLRAVARRLEATRLQLLDVFARAEEAAW